MIFLFIGSQDDCIRIEVKGCDKCDDKKDKAEFFYSLNGKKWNKIGAQLKMTYTLPHFMGYRFGLFNYATKEIGGIADFDFFHIDDEMSGSAEIYNKQQR